MVQVVFQTTKVVLVIFTAAHSRGCQDGRGGRLQGSLQNTLFKGGKISKRNLDMVSLIFLYEKVNLKKTLDF